MPRYFFEIHDNGTVRSDTTGLDLLEAEVRKTAVSLLLSLEGDRAFDAGDARSITVLVTDEDGRHVGSATLTCKAFGRSP